MNKIKRFEDLDIWKKATTIAIDIYSISEIGKLKNDFGMKDQIRRCATSISNNIAEGFEYDNNKDFVRFLKYAKGSSGELRNQLYILNKLEFISKEFFENKLKELIELSKQIAGFIKYLKNYENGKATNNL